MSILTDEPLMVELYRRLGEEGWNADAEPTLIGLVCNSRTFLRAEESLRLTDEGDFIGIRATPSLHPFVGPERPAYFDAHGLSPARLNALLDVMGILPSSDEWMQWFREGIWGPQGEGTIAST